MSGDYHGLFLGGIGEMEWYYFWEKRARGGSLPWLCEKRSFGDGCHSVLMGLSYSSYEALIQWR